MAPMDGSAPRIDAEEARALAERAARRADAAPGVEGAADDGARGADPGGAAANGRARSADDRLEADRREADRFEDDRLDRGRLDDREGAAMRSARSAPPGGGGGARVLRGLATIWRRLPDPFSFSTLAARIVALNVAALGVFVGGALYLSQFRAGLIDLRINSLKTEAELIAIAVAETAGDPENQRYDRIYGNEVLRRLALPIGLRAQLYDRSGRLTGDTRSLQGGTVAVEVETDPQAATADGALGVIEDVYDRIVRLTSRELEVYHETPPAGISSDREVYDALLGRWSSAERINSENELILSVAVPVQQVKTVLGALVLSTEGGDIDQIVRQERIAILEVFLVAFLATTLVSIALAQTIARPIRQLSRAADLGSAAGGSLELPRVDIPDFNERGDEIGDLSGSLRRMTNALYTRIDAIENFAADVAHEIKNPLTSLRSAVETLPLAKTPEARARLLRVLEHDVRRLDRLVTDISNASRLDAELVRDHREAFDFTRLLASVVSVAETNAGQRDAVVRLRTPQAPLRVRGLEGRLAQVFHNIIDNGLSFSPSGGVLTIEVSRQNGPRGPAVLVEIEDEGPGVPPENVESIFERFYSERPEGEEFGRHSGLGLSICRQIVEAHGGRIWAENRADRSGARFSVLLPM